MGKKAAKAEGKKAAKAAGDDAAPAAEAAAALDDTPQAASLGAPDEARFLREVSVALPPSRPASCLAPRAQASSPRAPPTSCPP